MVVGWWLCCARPPTWLGLLCLRSESATRRGRMTARRRASAPLRTVPRPAKALAAFEARGDLAAAGQTIRHKRQAVIEADRSVPHIATVFTRQTTEATRRHSPAAEGVRHLARG